MTIEAANTLCPCGCLSSEEVCHMDVKLMSR